MNEWISWTAIGKTIVMGIFAIIIIALLTNLVNSTNQYNYQLESCRQLATNTTDYCDCIGRVKYGVPRPRRND